jgi:hypothetical protein
MADWHLIGRYEVKENAESLKELLEDEGFSVKIRIENRPFDAITGRGPFPPLLWLYVSSEEIGLLRERLPDLLGLPPENHPFWSMEDLELIAIFRKSAEWGEENLALARRVLAERGLNIPVEVLAKEVAASKQAKAFEGGETFILPLVSLLALSGPGIAWSQGFPFFIPSATLGLLGAFWLQSQKDRLNLSYGAWAYYWTFVLLGCSFLSAYLAIAQSH